MYFNIFLQKAIFGENWRHPPRRGKSNIFTELLGELAAKWENLHHQDLRAPIRVSSSISSSKSSIFPRNKGNGNALA
ncbi:MAG TPA: hypothetical protein DDW76_05270 [Cyanobacteria bacterium UBA11369]|nr:hypothetical protein [Cyanobacteria bacterium UBA11371]HBE35049.1 hypothetical protein [Cyanobacteria bacterium UBA11368]HBE48217.1 hypothetical protein [Cyanobacteria bacterium UBA11369]